MRDFEEAWIYSDSLKGWYTRAEAKLLWDCAKQSNTACEVGAYRGRSSTIISAAGCTLYVIEPFILAPGSPNDTPESQGRYVSEEIRENIFKSFADNLRWFGHRSVYLLPWKTEDCCESIPALDLLHIDGDHIDGVFTDIELLTPKLRSGGIAIFHDYAMIHTKFTRVKDAVDALGWPIVGSAHSAIAIRKP